MISAEATLNAVRQSEDEKLQRAAEYHIAKAKKEGCLQKRLRVDHPAGVGEEKGPSEATLTEDDPATDGDR